MDTESRKLQQRIARRKERVQRLIEGQQTLLAGIESATFLRQQDYIQAKKTVRSKMQRLEQELSDLEAGQLSGPWK